MQRSTRKPCKTWNEMSDSKNTQTWKNDSTPRRPQGDLTTNWGRTNTVFPSRQGVVSLDKKNLKFRRLNLKLVFLLKQSVLYLFFPFRLMSFRKRLLFLFTTYVVACRLFCQSNACIGSCNVVTFYNTTDIFLSGNLCPQDQQWIGRLENMIMLREGSLGNMCIYIYKWVYKLTYTITGGHYLVVLSVVHTFHTTVHAVLKRLHT